MILLALYIMSAELVGPIMFIAIIIVSDKFNFNYDEYSRTNTKSLLINGKINKFYPL